MSSQPKKARKAGRPRLPKKEAMARIVPVRFNPDDLRAITAAARASRISSTKGKTSVMSTFSMNRTAVTSSSHGNLSDSR